MTGPATERTAFVIVKEDELEKAEVLANEFDSIASRLIKQNLDKSLTLWFDFKDREARVKFIRAALDNNLDAGAL